MTDFNSNQREPRFRDAHPYVKADNVAAYMGEQRPPFYPDEAGAALVVDLRFPEPRRARLALLSASEPGWYRVLELPAP